MNRTLSFLWTKSMSICRTAHETSHSAACPLGPQMAVIIPVENIPFPLIRLFLCTSPRSRVSEWHKIALYHQANKPFLKHSDISLSALLLFLCITEILSSRLVPLGTVLYSLIALRQTHWWKIKTDTHTELMDSFSEHLRAQRGENRNTAAWWDLFITPYFLRSEISLQPPPSNSCL